MIKEPDYIAIYLLRFKGIGPKSLQKPYPEGTFNHFSSLNPEINKTSYEKWKNNFTKYIENNNIHIISSTSPEYPSNLSNITNKPLYLFCKGNLELLQKPIFAVVGTRTPTLYGSINTQKITTSLSKAGFIIVSGMAVGIDSIAHKSSLSNGTIAVLASGFNYIYPAINIKLYNDILANDGLIITEYAPDIHPLPQYFPLRSRIIAALAQGLLVTEAAKKSGSLIAAKLAFEYSKNIYAIPADITRESCQGCNELIKNNIAKLTTSIDDIFEDYDISLDKNTNGNANLSENGQKLLNEIKSGKNTIDLLSESFDSSLLLSEITNLEMAGLIEKQGSEIYLKI